jgi:hypothetical protein
VIYRPCQLVMARRWHARRHAPRTLGDGALADLPRRPHRGPAPLLPMTERLTWLSISGELPTNGLPLQLLHKGCAGTPISAGSSPPPALRNAVATPAVRTTAGRGEVVEGGSRYRGQRVRRHATSANDSQDRRWRSHGSVEARRVRPYRAPGRCPRGRRSYAASPRANGAQLRTDVPHTAILREHVVDRRPVKARLTSTAMRTASPSGARGSARRRLCCLSTRIALAATNPGGKHVRDEPLDRGQRPRQWDCA